MVKDTPTTKKLINEPKDVVTEFLEGLVSSVPHLQLLEGSPDINVVVDAARPSKDKVAIISGGGAGHEPYAAGYVGEGMLASAVAGQVFASPSAKGVLAGIRAATGPAGCLLLVLNYTGDKLQFGLAAENAKAEGFMVEMVLVGDDCSLPGDGIAGRRGIAGTTLVTKVAGAAAAEGLSLQEVTRVAKEAAEQCKSVGVATHICTLPGAQPSDRLGEGEMEVGLGVHGEPGASTQPMQSASAVAAQMVDVILEDAANSFFEGMEVAMLVNNLGSTPLMETYIMAHAALKHAQDKLKVRVVRQYVGTLFTSLDMKGVSISLLPLDQQRLAWLDAPTQALAWPSTSGEVKVRKKVALKQASGKAGSASSRPDKLTPAGAALEKALLAAADALLAKAKQLDEWDQRVGDGDCGSTLAQGAKAIKADCGRRYPLNDVAQTMEAVAESVGNSMGGSSGALYQIYLLAIAGGLKSDSSSAGVSKALGAGLHAMQRYGGAKPGSRTMLDALTPATNAFNESLSKGATVHTALVAAAEAAAAGAESTKDMKASAGRSSYVPQQALHDVADPGASAVAVWIEAAAKALQ